MKNNTIISMVILTGLLFCVIGGVWALCAYYNRPAPVMDYVEQALGMYDICYIHLQGEDCRECHGDRPAVAKRHQFTINAFDDCPLGLPLDSSNCLTSCHDNPADPQSITNDCLECHSRWTNLPHHQTDLSDSGQCTACHRPDLLVNPRSVQPVSYYPAACTYTPTVFACENCHWSSKYPVYIDSPYYSHHHAFTENVAAKCYDCHSNVPSNPSWHPDNPLLIRYCEKCHTEESLHRIHAEDSYGWVAVGFHVAEHPGEDECETDYEPDIYRLFTSEEKCQACHGLIPPGIPTWGPQPPAIIGISPRFGLEGISCSISGANFGDTGKILLIPRLGKIDLTYSISSDECSWTTDMISFSIPTGINPGNYIVRVETAHGLSNMQVFTLTGDPEGIPCPNDPPNILNIEPTLGTEFTLVTIYGQNFGDWRMGGRTVQLNDFGDPPLKVPIPVYSWTDDRIQCRIPAWTLSPATYTISVTTEKGESNGPNFHIKRHPSLSSIDISGIPSITLSGAGFSDEQQGILGDGYGWNSTVKVSSKSRTISIGSGEISDWSDTEIHLTLPCLLPNVYGIIVETTYFANINSNGGYDSEDKIYHQVSTDPQKLEIITIPQEWITISDLRARSKSGRVQLTWTPVENAIHYNVYRSLTSGGCFEKIADSHITDYCTYLDVDVRNDVTYYYLVRSFNEDGTFGNSNETNATPRSLRSR